MTKRMTLAEFIKTLTEEMEKNEGWGDKEIEFYTIDGGDLEYLSIYDDSDKGDRIYIDVGTEKDNEEWNHFIAEISS